MSLITIELDLPQDWTRFRMPPALQNRLKSLLDRQDHEGELPAAERKEAAALAELADMLCLMKLRAERALSNAG